MRIKCLLCGDISKSKSLHDLLFYKCESYYVDEKSYYERIGTKYFSK